MGYLDEHEDKEWGDYLAESPDLDTLCARLNEIEEILDEYGLDHADLMIAIDYADLPVFADEDRINTEEIWAWDATRDLVYLGHDTYNSKGERWEMIPRKEVRDDLEQ